jgi:hypothetical protein
MGQGGTLPIISCCDSGLGSHGSPPEITTMPSAGNRQFESGKPATSEPVDPRAALMQQYMQRAQGELKEKEAEVRGSRGRRRPATPSDAPLAISFEGSVFVHAILVALTLTLAALSCLWCFHLMSTPGGFIAGRTIALPAGILTAIALSYLSISFMGIVESTSQGHTSLTDAVRGDWRDWFWTLPSTLGMAVLAGVIGYSIGYFTPGIRWTLVGVAMFFLFPVFHLSSLVSGSPLAPVSLTILRSLGAQAVSWLLFYVVTFALAAIVVVAARLAWTDPPYPTVLVMGPIISVALFIYAWLLGQLARSISKGNLE